MIEIKYIFPNNKSDSGLEKLSKILDMFSPHYAVICTGRLILSGPYRTLKSLIEKYLRDNTANVTIVLYLTYK